METTIFEKIIAREAPAHILCEDEQVIVILDIFPSTTGQSLVISKKKVDYFFELERPLYQHMLEVAQRIARASDAALGAMRTCMVVEGLEVPHAHIRLYPLITPPLSIASGPRADDAVLADVCRRIQAALATTKK